jgi:15-cis-phytoene synthase
MDQAFEYCAAQVREANKDRFLATLFAPERHRGPLFALYAFDAEMSEVRDRITSPLPGEVRLQWWRDVLTGTEQGDAAGNPIALALRNVVRDFTLPVPALLDLIDARTFDLYDDPMASLAALEAYAAATSAAMIKLAAQVLNDGQEPGWDQAIRHAGMANTLVVLMQQLALHSSRGQCYVPNDVLLRHGAQPADIHAGKVTAELRAALAELRGLARDHLSALMSGDVGVPGRLLPAFLPASLAPLALTEMERANADPFRPRSAPQWRRQWTLWRAARNPARFVNVKPDDPARTGGRQ